MLISQIPEDSPVVPKRGHIHIILKDLVISELGCDAWVRLLKMSGFAEEADVPGPEKKSLTLVGACFSVGLWLYC